MLVLASPATPADLAFSADRSSIVSRPNSASLIQLTKRLHVSPCALVAQVRVLVWSRPPDHINRATSGVWLHPLPGVSLGLGNIVLARGTSGCLSFFVNNIFLCLELPSLSTVYRLKPCTPSPAPGPREAARGCCFSYPLDFGRTTPSSSSPTMIPGYLRTRQRSGPEKRPGSGLWPEVFHAFPHFRSHSDRPYWRVSSFFFLYLAFYKRPPPTHSHVYPFPCCSLAGMVIVVLRHARCRTPGWLGCAWLS